MAGTEDLDRDAVYADQLPRVYNYFRFRLGREALTRELPDRERELIALKYGAAINNRLIAQLTGLSEGTLCSAAE